MKYQWEKNARNLCANDIVEFFSAFGNGGKFQIMSVAVANHETGEAALIKLDDYPNDVVGADMAQDVLGDAEQQYQKALKKSGLRP